MDLASALFPGFSSGKINGDSIPGLNGNTSSASNRSVNVINGPTGDSFLGMILSSALGGPAANGGVDLPWTSRGPETTLVSNVAGGSGNMSLLFFAGLLGFLYVFAKKA